MGSLQVENVTILNTTIIKIIAIEGEGKFALRKHDKESVVIWFVAMTISYKYDCESELGMLS